jgi:hypothetical protein
LQFCNKFRQNNDLLNRLRLNCPCTRDGAEINFHYYVTSALHRENWTASCSDHFNLEGSRPGMYWVGRLQRWFGRFGKEKNWLSAGNRTTIFCRPYCNLGTVTAEYPTPPSIVTRHGLLCFRACIVPLVRVHSFYFNKQCTIYIYI